MGSGLSEAKIKDVITVVALVRVFVHLNFLTDWLSLGMSRDSVFNNKVGMIGRHVIGLLESSNCILLIINSIICVLITIFSIDCKSLVAGILFMEKSFRNVGRE